MSLKNKIALTLGGAALLGAVAVPTTAIAVTADSTKAAASSVSVKSWTTTSKGGPLRTSPYGASSVIVQTYSGERLTVYSTTVNSYGNKWYDVIDSAGYSGFIYCGNVAAGC